MFLSSSETYCFSGNAIFASVVFPLWRGPVIANTGNCPDNRIRASYAFLLTMADTDPFSNLVYSKVYHPEIPKLNSRYSKVKLQIFQSAEAENSKVEPRSGAPSAKHTSFLLPSLLASCVLLFIYGKRNPPKPPRTKGGSA